MLVGVSEERIPQAGTLTYAGKKLGQTYISAFQNQRIPHSLQCAPVHCNSPSSGLYKLHYKLIKLTKPVFVEYSHAEFGTNTRKNRVPNPFHGTLGFCCGGLQARHRQRGKSLKPHPLLSQRKSLTYFFLLILFVCFNFSISGLICPEQFL